VSYGVSPDGVLVEKYYFDTDMELTRESRAHAMRSRFVVKTYDVRPRDSD